MPKKFAVIFLTFGIFFYGFGNTFAYDELTTHPALTDEIIDFYNFSYPNNPITQEERELIVRGVTLEDMPPRWINHFYDPVHNTAWTGENTGWLPPSLVQALRTIGLSTEEPLTSVDWINNRLTQERYSLYGGDRTWKQALDYYAEGNKNEAHHTLGYVLHLLEDATVPEHTRDDPHAHALSGVTGDYGSPYEEYTKKWTRETIGALQIANRLKDGGILPIKRNSIEEHITEAAIYSNRYFFTKDTINDQKYEFPKIVRDDGNFGYGFDENGSEFILARIVYKKLDNNELVKTYEIQNESKYHSILDSYFSRLSRKAVIEGAGAIKLFKEQAEQFAADAAINKEFPNHLLVRDPDTVKLFNTPTISLFGELYKIWTAAQSLFGNFINTAQALTVAIFDKFIAVVGPGQTSVAPRSESAATSTPSQPNRAEETQVPPPVTASPTAQETTANNPASQNPTSSPAVVGTSTPSTGSGDSPNAPVVWGVSGTPAPTVGISVSGGSPAPGDGGPTPHDSTSTGELPPLGEPSLPKIENFIGEFSHERLEIDFFWSSISAPSGTAPIYFLSEASASGTVATTTATSTNITVPGYGQDFIYSIIAQSENGAPLSEISTTTVSVPDWLIDIQPLKDEESRGSHYSDNWYRLGTGFYGTVYALILEGYVDKIFLPGSQSSHVFIDEFLDAGYTILNRTFTVSDAAPFVANEKKTAIIKGLNISLQPNKFYRLRTFHDEQNASVILSGTSATTSVGFGAGGTAMFNYFVGGTGRVEEMYNFYPFMQAVMRENFPPQSAPFSPEITSLDFNETALTLAVGWASSTDADTPGNLIKYEFNHSTSSELADENWQEVAARSVGIALEFPNSYKIGVRAKDDFDNTSDPTLTDWNFPDGFTPSVLSSSSVNSATQDFVLASGGSLRSIKVSTAEFSTISRNSYSNICYLDLYAVNETSTTLLAQNDLPNPDDGVSAAYAYRGESCAGDLTFTYASLPEIAAGKRYQWKFYIGFGGTVKFWGKLVDTACGEPCRTAGINPFSDPSIVNAKFTLKGDGGTLFSN